MPATLVHVSPMAGLGDLTDDERAAIVTALRQAIDRDRYPLSPRLKPFKSAGEARSRVVPKRWTAAAARGASA